MKAFLFLSLVAALVCSGSFGVVAQDEGGKKGPKPKEKKEKRGEDEGKRDDEGKGDGKGEPKKQAGDDDGGKKKDCGCDRDEYKKSLKKKGKDDDVCDRETVEHFKKVHPDGGKCHCSCEHSAKPKGNNGVGNGVDPQPPGNPKPNDGAGTGPGNPGNKGGQGDKGKGKS